jgi:sigma-B regulation protein RsbU (phosphoserine phosphatase)
MQTSLKQHIDELQATTASKERLQSELVIAHDIQMGMLTTVFPERDDLELFASMTPAKEVGGDLYDFIIEGDEVFFIIGDVAGKAYPHHSIWQSPEHSSAIWQAIIRVLLTSCVR